MKRGGGGGGCYVWRVEGGGWRVDVGMLRVEDVGCVVESGTCKTDDRSRIMIDK